MTDSLRDIYYISCVFIKPSETFIHDHSQLGDGLKRIVTYFDLGPSASQSSDGDASAASWILVVSFLQVCLFWATDLKCSRSFRLVSCSLSSDTRVRSLLRTTGSVVKGRPLNLLPCDIK